MPLFHSLSRIALRSGPETSNWVQQALDHGRVYQPIFTVSRKLGAPHPGQENRPANNFFSVRMESSPRTFGNTRPRVPSDAIPEPLSRSKGPMAGRLRISARRTITLLLRITLQQLSGT